VFVRYVGPFSNAQRAEPSLRREVVAMVDHGERWMSSKDMRFSSFLDMLVGRAQCTSSYATDVAGHAGRANQRCRN
jgi:hypothetical protein